MSVRVEPHPDSEPAPTHPASQHRAKRRSRARSARPPQGVDGRKRGATIVRVGVSAANAETALDALLDRLCLSELALFLAGAGPRALFSAPPLVPPSVSSSAARGRKRLVCR